MRNLILLIIVTLAVSGPAFAQEGDGETMKSETTAEETPPVMKEPSWTDKVSIGGEARFRSEARDNKDFTSGTGDRMDFIGTRIRMNFTLTPVKNVKAFFQPQFSGEWGRVETAVSGSGTAAPGAVTSGALRDPDLDFHQGYLLWDVTGEVGLKLGRQELTYGEHVVIGNVGFSNVGRSFDAGLVRFKYDKHVFDAFLSRLAENDVAGSGLSGNDDFAGLYASFAGPWMYKEIDFYGLWFRNARTGTTAFNFGTLGLRVKGTMDRWDGRFEGAFQVGDALGADMRAYMIDIEKGYTFDVLKGLRVAAEYNRASGDDPSSGTFTRYHQLFPTAHKWLGYMDFFGRQNIQSGVFHVALGLDEQWKIAADLHSFWRVEENDVLYSLATETPVGGQANPPTDGKMHAGEELDMVLSYKPIEQVALELMGGVFIPGAYIERSIGDDLSYFSYLQAKFAL